MRGRQTYLSFHEKAGTKVVLPFELIEPHLQEAWVQAARTAADFRPVTDGSDLKMWWLNVEDVQEDFYVIAKTEEEFGRTVEETYGCTTEELLEGYSMSPQDIKLLSPQEFLEIRLRFPCFGLSPGTHSMRVEEWCRVVGEGCLILDNSWRVR